ncbi:NCS1 family nucleobase:cation symporter-1 [Megamonas hypermegale]|uniref:NCS1 family nucleobase:cation symporter-1 n=1 Tax=Megamonas hypermegale TaxID=158847 RepID=UPI0026F2D2D3|nr:NCS1 family nucleobase:cation symporter-1 [Megamonas hypermegale]
MNMYQRQIGDIVELTDEGLKAIKNYPNNYTDNTRPVPVKERNWSAISITNLWVGMLVSIAVYQVASGLIVAGMSWWQALFTIVLGHSLVMFFAVVLGHFGTRYGVTYPMLCKFIFGSKGTIVPSIVRGGLGCFWFGVQAWIGGQALNAIFEVLFPSFANETFLSYFISFIIFWAINVYIASSGSNAIKALENYSAPLLIVLSFIVIIWGLYTADWSIYTLLSVPALQGNPDKNFWDLFFPALSAMIAFDGGIALSMADFTRNCKTQKAQIIGQLTAAPIMTAFISFVGICGTGGAFLAFNEAIWEPAVLVSKFNNPFIVIIFSVFIIMAVLTTNVAANLVPPTNVISTLFAKKISYKAAAIIAAVLALFAQPWNALSSAYTLIFNVCGILGALLGPISGLYVVAYLIEHRCKVNLVDLYREDNNSQYYYYKGWNVGIISIFILSSIIILIGKFVPSLEFVFNNSYVIGSIGAGVLYYFYLKMNFSYEKKDLSYEKNINN